jgi:hypothetical protein
MRRVKKKEGVKKMSKTIAVVEFSEAEIAVRMILAIVEKPRLPGITPEMILDRLPEEDREMWLRATRSVLEYVINAVNDSQRVN